MGGSPLTTYRVHVLVKGDKDREDDVVVEAINSIEASQKAVAQYAEKGITAYTISVWSHKT